MAANFILAHSPAEISRMFSLAEDPKPRIDPFVLAGDCLPILESEYLLTRKTTEAKWGVPFPFSSDSPKFMCYVRSEYGSRKQRLGLYDDLYTCAVPVSAIIATHKPRPDMKQMCVCRCDRKIILIAGVMCSWRSAKGQATYAFLILTRPADKLLLPENNRMPFILNYHEVDDWLLSDPRFLQHILEFTPFPCEKLESIVIEENPSLIFNYNRTPLETLLPRSAPNEIYSIYRDRLPETEEEEREWLENKHLEIRLSDKPFNV